MPRAVDRQHDQNRPTISMPAPLESMTGAAAQLDPRVVSRAGAAGAALPVSITRPSTIASRPPACPTPLTTASAVRPITVSVVQLDSREPHPTSASAIHGPTTGRRKSRALGASGQRYEVPTDAPYQPAVKA